MDFMHNKINFGHKIIALGDVESGKRTRYFSTGKG
jgi:hypothetical protein